MKLRLVSIFFCLFIFTGCVSIPKETVDLSKTLGTDLLVLQNAHRNSTRLLFSRMKVDVNSFIDDVYAPFVIHYVLKLEMQAYLKGQNSLYRTIELAGKEETKKQTEEAIEVMENFLKSARNQIDEKRNELLAPILDQEIEAMAKVDEAYNNVIYANTSITNYLQSIQDVKKAQSEALANIGLSGLDGMVTNTLVNLSKKVSTAVEKGREIDIQSDEALLELEKIFSEIRDITN